MSMTILPSCWAQPGSQFEPSTCVKNITISKTQFFILVFCKMSRSMLSTFSNQNNNFFVRFRSVITTLVVTMMITYHHYHLRHKRNIAASQNRMDQQVIEILVQQRKKPLSMCVNSTAQCRSVLCVDNEVNVESSNTANELSCSTISKPFLGIPTIERETVLNKTKLQHKFISRPIWGNFSENVMNPF